MKKMECVLCLDKKTTSTPVSYNFEKNMVGGYPYTFFYTPKTTSKQVCKEMLPKKDA